jgi:hypothetical protein
MILYLCEIAVPTSLEIYNEAGYIENEILRCFSMNAAQPNCKLATGTHDNAGMGPGRHSGSPGYNEHRPEGKRNQMRLVPYLAVSLQNNFGLGPIHVCTPFRKKPRKPPTPFLLDSL